MSKKKENENNRKNLETEFEEFSLFYVDRNRYTRKDKEINLQ